MPSGLELATLFHHEVVAPLLAGVPYSAALLGPGSEVLGFDTGRSTDHDWGPRLQVFVDRGEVDALAARVDAALPATFRGYATRWPHSHGGPSTHHVEVAEPGAWFAGLVGFDPRTPPTAFDWLATPTQRLAETTTGAVLHDGTGTLAAIRATLAWYPDDIWRHVLACQWERIGEEMAFPGRCAEVGDVLGASILIARLVRELVRLAMLMARRWPPYGKWLGTAFARLPDPDGLGAALAAATRPEQEHHLVAAYRAVATRHNALGLTDPQPTEPQPYFDRPYLVPACGRIAAALRAGITSPDVRAFGRVGAIDQLVDAVDVLGGPAACRATLAALAHGQPPVENDVGVINSPI